MIKLRLKRLGKIREVSYRIVAVQSTSRRDGRPLEELGYYNPRTDEIRLEIPALVRRLRQGAQPTDTVRRILERANLFEHEEIRNTRLGKRMAANAAKVTAKIPVPPPSDDAPTPAPEAPEDAPDETAAEAVAAEATSDEATSDEAAAEETASDEAASDEAAAEAAAAEETAEIEPEKATAEAE